MINVRQFCEPSVGVFESGRPQFQGIGDKTLCSVYSSDLLDQLILLRKKKESFFLAVHVLVPSGALERSYG